MKKTICTLMAVLILITSLYVPVSALGIVNMGSVYTGETKQMYISYDTTHRYKFVADEDQYYRFTFLNQSVETRAPAYSTLGNILASLFDMTFNGLFVSVYDAHELPLASKRYMGGYTGSISLNLKKGETYYIEVTANEADGNYRFTAEKLNDIGANTWQTALEVEPTQIFVSSVDAPGDQDWFKFRADSTLSFQDFSLENISSFSKIYLYLYEYVPGAGEKPLRYVDEFYSSYTNTTHKDYQLKKGSLYYYCVTSEDIGGYLLDVTQRLDAAGSTNLEAYKVDTYTYDTVPTVITTSIDGSCDVDRYYFKTADFDAYYFFTRNFLGDPGYDAFTRLIDSSGNILCEYRNNSKNTYCFDYKLKPNTTYFLEICGTKICNYDFNIAVKKDEYPDEKYNATAVETNKKYSSGIDGHGDIDFVSFTTEDYEAYYYFSREFLGDPGYDSFTTLIDSNGNTVAEYSNSSKGSYRFDYKLAPNSTYYLKFEGQNPANYDFTISVDKDEYPNEMENAVAVETNKKYSASFNGNEDTDYISFTTEDYEAYYSFDRTMTAEPGYYARTYLYDSDGTLVTDQRNNGKGSYSFNIKLDPGSTYYIKFQGDNVVKYDFTINVSKDDYPNVQENATAVEIGTEYEAAFNGNNDSDFISFTTSEIPSYYTFSRKILQNPGYYSKTVIYDGNGKEVTSQTNNSSTSYSFDVKLNPSTTYYAKFYGEYKADYTFKITAKEDRDGDTAETATPVFLNQNNSCAFEVSGDIDWFVITLNRNAVYRINTTLKTCKGVSLYIYNENMESVHTAGASSGSFYSSTVTLEAGTYYIKATHGYVQHGTFTFIFADCGAEHSEKVIYDAKSTFKQNGTKKTVCSKCQQTLDTETVYAVKEITVSKTSFTANGKAQKPTVKVTDINGNKITSYTAKYSNSKSSAPGKYTVKVTLSGAYSGEKTFTYKINLATPVPTVANVAGGIKISWNKVTSATHYIVYRSTYSNGNWSSWVKIGTSKTASYTDKKVTSGKKVKYYVIASDGKTTSGKKASSSTKYLSAPTPKISAASDGVKISWSKTSGATVYTIYRSTYANKSWSSWAKIGTSKTTSYTDKKAVSGKSYKYFVLASDGNFKSAKITSSSFKYLSTPTTKAAVISGGVKVSWNKSNGANLYTVYRSTYSGSKWSSWTKIGTSKSLSYTDKKVSSGKTVKYSVVASNGNTLSARKASAQMKYLSAPSLKAAVTADGIKVSWGKVSGAAKYVIYRCTSVNGKWSAWKELGTTSALKFTDKNVKKGTVYIYRVKAINGKASGAYSSWVKIKK